MHVLVCVGGGLFLFCLYICLFVCLFQLVLKHDSQQNSYILWCARTQGRACVCARVCARAFSATKIALAQRIKMLLADHAGHLSMSPNDNGFSCTLKHEVSRKSRTHLIHACACISACPCMRACRCHRVRAFTVIIRI